MTADTYRCECGHRDPVYKAPELHRQSCRFSTAGLLESRRVSSGADNPADHGTPFDGMLDAEPYYGAMFDSPEAELVAVRRALDTVREMVENAVQVRLHKPGQTLLVPLLTTDDLLAALDVVGTPAPTEATP